jgi:hypothetical protein
VQTLNSIAPSLTLKNKQNMKNLLFASIVTLLSVTFSIAQPTVQWQKSVGGTGNDYAESIQQTNDGGYIVVGISYSNDGDVSGNQGASDCWVVKLNAFGTIEWEKSMGGSGDDNARLIQQTNDGGYIFIGPSDSNDGDVSGNHGNLDYWAVKLTSTGVIEWQKSLGGTGYEYAQYIQQTSDGGYIAAGSSFSNDGDVSGNHGGFDCWVVKLNNEGTIVWQKSLGGLSNDEAESIQQTNDGGFILAGHSDSNDGDVSGNHGGPDYWVVKLSSIGTIEWQKSLGGSGSDQAKSVQQTNDGGFIVAGYTSSNDGDVSVNYGYLDFWVVKLNSLGTIEWQKTLGGSDFDLAQSIQQTNDGEYIVAGYSYSNDVDVQSSQGNQDFWVVKLSSIGTIEWEKSLGGSGLENASSIQQTNEGGFIVAGSSNSNDGDVSGNQGNSDYWVVQLKSCQPSFSTQPANQIIDIYSNAQFIVSSSDPTATYQWQTDLGVGFQNLNNIGQYSGTTNDTLLISDVVLTNDNQPFRCIISSGSCSDTSSVAILIVKDNIGINEVSQSNLYSVYPNPAQDLINIKADAKLLESVYTIYDAIGKVVLIGKIKSENAVIEIGNLSGGIYLFSVGENQNQTFKVIKQ